MTSVLIVGGLAIVVVGLLGTSSTRPLAVVGAGWALAGTAIAGQMRRVVHTIEVDGATVTFVSQRKTRQVLLGDILAVSRTPRFDPGRMGFLVTRCRSGERLSAVLRLEGLDELLSALKDASPEIQLRHLQLPTSCADWAWSDV